ncbi:YihY/virulence factor BrkB family protein [Spirulina major CS-329]|uniref:YihY/virulence factor BrkB family protein n=2 Tax=Spirulinaceae TaxID=1890448 RepID=UPI00232FAA88|nr:YihY/virulence factor BrkB family protein [Spirulina major]MDB9504109.1 YihY/virulence factor BrkB family protein [Spirulina major CS-329]
MAIIDRPLQLLRPPVANRAHCDRKPMKLPAWIRFFYYLRWPAIRITTHRVFRQRLNGLAAEMAYGSMLALFPTILAVLTAIGLFEDSIQGWLRNLLAPFMVVNDASLQTVLRDAASALRIVVPDLMWQLLSNFVQEVTEQKNGGLFSISFLAAIWIASSALCTAMNALDQIHRIPPRLRRPFWQSRGVAILLTLGSIVLLAIAAFFVLIGNQLIISTLAIVEQFPLYRVKDGTYLFLRLWSTLNLPFVLSLVVVAFVLMYRLGPSRWRPETPVLPGALLAACSWLGVSWLFQFYVDNFGTYNRVYGAVGTVIILMLWLYLTSLVMLVGSQLNVTVGEIMRADQAQAITPRAPQHPPAKPSHDPPPHP